MVGYVEAEAPTAVPAGVAQFVIISKQAKTLHQFHQDGHRSSFDLLIIISLDDPDQRRYESADSYVVKKINLVG